MTRLRQTKKLRQLLAHVRSRRLPGFTGAAASGWSHDDLYWRAAQAGLAYDADAGWYVAETPAAAPGSPFDVRLEGPHATLVAAEEALRGSGLTIVRRTGPNPGRGGVWLTYLGCALPRRGRAS